jgi:hypothetical protein
MGAAVASEVADLYLAHAVLGGPGKLVVTRHMYWGPAGAMLGVGDVVLGHGSKSVISTGTGSEAGLIGGDDGTGPHAFDAKHAPAPPCGPYSPPWAGACATRHRADNLAIGRVWARFATLVNAGRLEAIVALLEPRTCGLIADEDRDNVIRRRGDCRRVARAAVARAAAERPFALRLRDVYVEGDRAVAGTNGPGSTIRFSRVHGAWLIREV